MKKLSKLTLFFIGLLFIVGIYIYHREVNTILVLNGSESVVIEYGKEYLDKKASVSYLKNVIKTVEAEFSDLDLTKVGTYSKQYKYKWLFKEKVVKRKISVVDTIAPVLSLKGEQQIMLKVSEKYFEPGFIVSDNYDQDLVDKVEIIGEVDSNQVGEYKLVYQVKDSSNNKTSVERIVTVYQPAVKVSPPKDTSNKKGVIYLTFDDGPHGVYTNQILDILQAESIYATFFVTGSGPDEVILRINQLGHSIALHTYSHKYDEVYASVDNYYQDLELISERVERLVNIKSNIIRFPGGSSNTVSRKYTENIMSFLVKDVSEKGYIYHDWNIDSLDATSNISATAIYNNVINNLSKNQDNIVLLHDVYNHTSEALPNIIKYAKANGYTFKKITETTIPFKHKVNN